ncbi:PREDICTED: chymotrypsin-2-like [Nicrophorus vespilloides]|uniref:Chymotrypsin-2-like n=1 Tax=Nicrophorus vespilloides TaxID=110193 RepID=A0ABM1MCP1_NICVS|nr:PREDICTED: chymotrypsin-2-like [Nicrophorus vespilloides]
MFQIVIALIIQIPLALHAQTFQHIDLNNISNPYEIDYATSLVNFKGPFNTKIVNGILAPKYQFPYQAAIYIESYRGDTIFCGGSLISNDIVITAAHCIFAPPRRILVILGNTDLSKYNPTEIRVDADKFLVHHAFNPISLKNDICLLHLQQSINFNEAVSPISLPNYNDVRRNFLNNVGVVSGFGKTTENGDVVKNLMYLNVRIMDNQLCNEAFHDRDAGLTNICSSGFGRHGACQGDSGGPLAIDDKLIGIVSFGSKFCSNGLPTVYTRVPMFLEWISCNSNIRI